MSKRLLHRGAVDNRGRFAKEFVLARLAGFEKDMEICLKAIPSKTKSGDTHAYFPALTASCGTLEYLASMHCGKTRGVDEKQVTPWARLYMPQPDYDEEVVRILFVAFRNSIAHRGIASGVYIDKRFGPANIRRLTWEVSEEPRQPAIQVREEAGILNKDPPWPCRYTHRVHIYLATLITEIMIGAHQFASDLEINEELHGNFYSCMEKLYPK